MKPDANSLPASEAGVFLWMTWQAMQRMGLDTASVFASVNLPDELPDPVARRANATQQRFWRAAEQASGDADIGLHVGAMMPPFRGHVLEYLFLSSPTFEAGLRRAHNYSSLLTNTFRWRLEVADGRAALVGFDHPVRHFLECALAVTLGFLAQVTEGDFRASAIWLPHDKGAAAQEYERVYGCPVVLGQPQGAILFDAALLARPSPAAAPQLLALHEELAQQQLVSLQKRELVARVEKELGRLLEGGGLTLEAVAARLDLPPRRLRSELAQAGTSFNELVAAYRERLARRLLARTQESLDQIIYLTGFSEPAAFSRAFKRWTGETPTEYRQRKRDA